MQNWQAWQESLIQYFSFLDNRPLLHAGLILFGTWVFAWIFDRVIVAVARRLASKTETDIDDHLFDLMHRPLFYSILVFGLSLATHVVHIPNEIYNILFPVLYTVLLLMWTMFLLKFAKVMLRKMAFNQRHFGVLHPQTLPLFENLALIVILVLSVYYILSSWDIDMTAWLASAGIVGIAVGFAAKDTLANLFSGVFIMADAPYKIGDYIVLETGERGEVTNIGLRSTRILTRDNIEVTVPNSVMGNTKVINESGGPSTQYRIRTRVGVAYGSDIDLARSVLQSVADNEIDICTNPPPVVRFRTFGGSSLDFDVMGWITEPALRGRIIDKLNTEIYKKFAEHNIEIPYHKQDVYIKEFPGRNNAQTGDHNSPTGLEETP